MCACVNVCVHVCISKRKGRAPQLLCAAAGGPEGSYSGALRAPPCVAAPYTPCCPPYPVPHERRALAGPTVPGSADGGSQQAAEARALTPGGSRGKCHQVGQGARVKAAWCTLRSCSVVTVPGGHVAMQALPKASLLTRGAAAAAQATQHGCACALGGQLSWLLWSCACKPPVLSLKTSCTPACTCCLVLLADRGYFLGAWGGGLIT